MDLLIPQPAGVGPPGQGPPVDPQGHGPKARPGEEPGHGFEALVWALVAPGAPPPAELDMEVGVPPGVTGEDAAGPDRTAEALSNEAGAVFPLIGVPTPGTPGVALVATPAAIKGDAPIPQPTVTIPVAEASLALVADAAAADEAASTPDGQAAEPSAGPATTPAPRAADVQTVVVPAQAAASRLAEPPASVRGDLTEVAPVAAGIEGQTGGREGVDLDLSSDGNDRGRERSAGAPSPPLADAALNRAPRSDHASATAFAATHGPHGPGGVASVAAPAVAEAPADPAVLVERLADTVETAATRGPNELRLVIRPPELGHLDLRVIESSEGVRVVIEASTHEARDVIQRELPALRAALEGRDLRVQRLDVQHVDLAGSNLANEQQEPHGRRDAREQQSEQPAAFERTVERDERADRTPSWSGGQHVDVRA